MQNRIILITAGILVLCVGAWSLISAENDDEIHPSEPINENGHSQLTQRHSQEKKTPEAKTQTKTFLSKAKIESIIWNRCYPASGVSSDPIWKAASVGTWQESNIENILKISPAIPITIHRGAGIYDVVYSDLAENTPRLYAGTIRPVSTSDGRMFPTDSSWGFTVTRTSSDEKDLEPDLIQKLLAERGKDEPSPIRFETPERTRVRSVVAIKSEKDANNVSLPIGQYQVVESTLPFGWTLTKSQFAWKNSSHPNAVEIDVQPVLLGAMRLPFDQTGNPIPPNKGHWTVLHGADSFSSTLKFQIQGDRLFVELIGEQWNKSYLYSMHLVVKGRKHKILDETQFSGIQAALSSFSWQ